MCIATNDGLCGLWEHEQGEENIHGMQGALNHARVPEPRKGKEVIPTDGDKIKTGGEGQQ